MGHSSFPGKRDRLAASVGAASRFEEFSARGSSALQEFPSEILGVRSSFAARLDIFKNGESTGTTAARGRSLLAALYAGRKSFEPGSYVGGTFRPVPVCQETMYVPIS
jgi:hypothetical protein